MRVYPGEHVYDSLGHTPANKQRWFRQSGEFRPPRRGEFYLSGEIPMAYRAPNDLGDPYHIMEEIKLVDGEIVKDGRLYRIVEVER